MTAAGYFQHWWAESNRWLEAESLCTEWLYSNSQVGTCLQRHLLTWTKTSCRGLKVIVQAQLKILNWLWSTNCSAHSSVLSFLWVCSCTSGSPQVWRPRNLWWQICDSIEALSMEQVTWLQQLWAASPPSHQVCRVEPTALHFCINQRAAVTINNPICSDGIVATERAPNML